MKTLRIISANFRKIITSPGFYACFALTVILCFSAGLYTDGITMNKYSIISSFVEFDKEKMLSDTAFCSYNVVVRGSGSWLSMFIPIVAAFAFIPLLCDERESKAIRYTAFRTTKFSFNTGNFLTAMLSGGLSVLLGFAIFAVMVYLLFPSINEYDVVFRESFESWLSDIYPKFPSWGYSYLIVLKLIEMFLYGALSALPAFVMTGVMKNKYLITCIPFFLKYMLTQTHQRLISQAIEDYENINEKLLKVLGITDLDAVSYLFSVGNGMWKNLLFYTALIVVAYAIYYISMNRRLDYGE